MFLIDNICVYSCLAVYFDDFGDLLYDFNVYCRSIFMQLTQLSCGLILTLFCVYVGLAMLRTNAAI